MGFNIEMMFDEMLDILYSDIKASKKCKQLAKIVIESKRYAEECGMFDSAKITYDSED
jgi:hypothetical protein